MRANRVITFNSALRLALDEKNYPKQREIRSFVVRSGRMTAGQKRGWDSYWDTYGLEPTQRFDLPKIFGNNKPVVLEIGFGMGGSLHAMAKADPDTNFIGVEVHRPGIGALLALAGDDGLANLRVFCCDANLVIDDCLGDASLARLQLFFPDPWHKKRHHKRRIVQDEFVTRIAQKLECGGIFHMATDWQPYAEYMGKVMQGREDFSNQAGDAVYSEKPGYRPDTKFEHRGIKLGHGVWDLLYEKTSPSRV
jgi:tRNA (guanine-N7-)-methyltransferase